MEVVKKRCALTREACVEIDEEIRLFCEKMRIERRDGLKTRLSAEDCLTYWMDHGSGGNTVTLRVGMRLLTPMITLEMEGNTSNPFEEELGEFGNYLFSLHAGLAGVSVVICAAMAIAAPPVPGGSAIVYSLLFAQMGIPEEAIALGLTLDLIFDFLNTALTVALMGPFMVNTASDLDMIDPEVLRSA